MRTRSSAAALAVVVALALHAGPAAGHDASSPLAVAVELERTRLAVYLRYSIERGEQARALREQFDRDADGTLADDERERLTAWLIERARRGFHIRVGSAQLAFAQSSVSAELEGSGDARLAVVVRLDAAVKWPSKEATLTIAAELADARAITPVAVRIGRGAGLELPAGFEGGVASKGAPLELRVLVSARRR